MAEKGGTYVFFLKRDQGKEYSKRSKQKHWWGCKRSLPGRWTNCRTFTKVIQGTGEDLTRQPVTRSWRILTESELARSSKSRALVTGVHLGVRSQEVVSRD